jgi:ethanolamine ammonia-lyase small subunit
VNTNLEICDEDVEAMKAECDTHFDVMSYCKDKREFMTNYIAGRNLAEESVGKVASSSPK